MVRKVLMLHGYAQNASIFSKRMGAIRKACGKDVELVFVDAPHILYPVDLVSFSSQSQSLESLGAAEVSSTTESDSALTPRAWWKVDAARTQAIGINDSVTLFKDILSKETYDGVFGFSQGASMAAVLAALLEKPHLHTPFLIDDKPPHPPFKFCIAVSGFKAPGPLAASVFTPFYSTPTLHVLGKTDVIVVEERSKTLLAVSENKRLEEHDGGHFVPSKSNWRNFFRDYLKDPSGNIPSPGLSSASSAPESGMVTPTTAAFPTATATVSTKS